MRARRVPYRRRRRPMWTVRVQELRANPRVSLGLALLAVAVVLGGVATGRAVLAVAVAVAGAVGLQTLVRLSRLVPVGPGRPGGDGGGGSAGVREPRRPTSPPPAGTVALVEPTGAASAGAP